MRLAVLYFIAALFALYASPAAAQGVPPDGAVAVPVEGSDTEAVAEQPTAQPVMGEYRINPGDELQIYVWGEERLQRSVKVLPDGTFAFPLVGRIRAENYLPSEIELIISNGLRDQYRGQVPQVSVSVITPAGMQFSILGRVANPGTFTPGRYISVLEALSMAGGPTEFARLDNVQIIRRRGSQVSTIRARLSSIFNATADAEAIEAAANTLIETGDTLIVP